ncbi:hypothetical protein H0E87_017713 [Populus deltoides]|uniref:Uncharacterized protein n=1 Tax=Populus deltoides TaxID=3696 RepID=A0A8T2Y1E1_POPDE|nr:hypothetical protein H0E87_017713 [Populus deltoides]
MGFQMALNSNQGGGGIVWRDNLPSDADSKNEKTIASGNAGTSTTKSEEEKVSASKPVARAQAKVPFEKGYSQMDWLKLTQKHHDLAEGVAEDQLGPDNHPM